MAAVDDQEVSRALQDVVERVQSLPRCRETRSFVAAGERLASALRAPRPAALLDGGARADVSHAVRDVRDVVARSAAANSPRVALLSADPERKTRRIRLSARPALRAADRKVLDAAAKRVEATAQVALYKARTATATGPGPAPALASDPADRFEAEVTRREWEFSLVKAPITPLSARDLDRAPHGALLPALWRGARVSVRVMRRDRARFYTEGDYLWRLGDSPCVPKLLGGHWSSASTDRTASTDVGYLVIEVVNGTSLDKLVRQQRLAATLNQLRVLDRIVTALLHAQTVVPALSHQDLHPGNIFLVPTNASSPLSCTLTPPVVPSTTPASSVAGGSPLPSPGGIPTQPAQPPASAAAATATAQHTPPLDAEDDDPPSVGSANSITVNDAPVLADTAETQDAPPLDPAVSDEEGANGEPGSPVRSDTTLDARVRRAASTAAARGDVALARGMLSMHSIQTRMRSAAAGAAAAQAAQGSTQSLSQRTAGALLGAAATAKRARPPAAYLVKVLDFAPSSEALGRRGRTSWSNPTVAGYCAPEMASPRMWRRAGDHRQRHNISALRHDSVGRKSSDSSNTTLSAVVHTPNVQRPASPMAPKNAMARSLSYPRKPAAPIDTAEGVMFDDNLNNDLDVLAPPFGRVHSLDSTRLDDDAAAVPRKMMTHHAAISGNSNSQTASVRSSVLQGGPNDDEPRELNKLEDRLEPPKKVDRTAEPKRMASLYRRISAHRSRSSELLGDKGGDANKTQLTGNIIGAVLSRASGGARVFDDVIPSGGTNNGTGAQRTNGLESGGERALAIAKVDVWSLGWLLYYMATGEHPPADAWASTRPLAAINLNRLAPEIADVMRFCVVHDVASRASLPELKKRLEAHMRRAVFTKGLSLLTINPRHAFKLLDKVVGIRVPSGSAAVLDDLSPSECALEEHNEDTVELAAALQRRANSANPQQDGKRPRSHQADRYQRLQSSFSENVPDVRAQSLAIGSRSPQLPTAIGLNPRTRAALSTLPVVIVRRVEWEFAARKYECPARDLLRLRRALITERWTKSEVADGELAIAYLRRRCAQGVTSAQSALGWVYRWGAGGAPKEVARAVRLWEAAMHSADPEAANGLGLIYHHGRRDIKADGRRAQRYYEAAVEQGYPAAAVNLGVMLHDGAAGLPNDGLSAKALYELASQHGDAIAANNLGLLFQHGAPGVDKEPSKAVIAYELAITRGERNHARRNLAELLFDGAPGVARNVTRALEMLARAADEGDQPSRQAAQSKLRALVARDKDAVRSALPKSVGRGRISDLVAL